MQKKYLIASDSNILRRIIMQTTVALFQGIIIILYGLVLSTRKKFIINRVYESIFSFFIITMLAFTRFIEMGQGLIILFFTIVMIILAIMINTGKYTITNTNSKILVSILSNILEEKGITYEEEEKAIKLTGDNNKLITYIQSMNTLRINLKDIKGLPLYGEIIKELKIKIKESNEVVFPTEGILMLVLGIFFIGMIIYFEKMI